MTNNRCEPTGAVIDTMPALLSCGLCGQQWTDGENPPICSVQMDDSSVFIATAFTPPPPSVVNIRGHDVEINTLNDWSVMFLALLALDDPRVDAVLKAARWSLQTADGTVIP